MPKNSRRFLVVILAAGLGVVLRHPSRTISAAADRNPVQAEQALAWKKLVRVTLTGDKTKASLDDVLTIDTAIRNDGPEPVYLFTRLEWGVSGGMALFIRNEAGEVVGAGDRILWPPQPEDDPTRLVRLDRERFYGARRRLPLKSFMRKPGKYTLQAEYWLSIWRGGLAGERIRALQILTDENPALYCNKLDFEVLP
jgi:hypothetical protein